MTGLTELTTTWVDSLGGGIGVLKNLGALGTTVFSKQIAGGINNAISGITRGSSNKQTIANAFQQAVNIQNIEGMDKYTKDIMEQQKKILRVSSILKPEELKELQDGIRALSPTVDELNRVSQLREQYEKIEQKVANIEGIGPLDNVEKLEAVRQKLVEINEQIDGISTEGLFTAVTPRNQWKAQGVNAEATLREMTEQIQYYKNRGLVSAESEKSWIKVAGQFRDFVEDSTYENRNFTADAAQRYNELAKLASEAFVRILQEAKETNDGILADLLKSVKEGGEDVRSQQEKLAKEAAEGVEALNKPLDPKNRQLTIQGMVEIAGAAQTIGIAFENLRRIPKIFADDTLSDNEKMAQGLANVGQTALTAVPSVLSLVNSFKLLGATHPILLAITTVISGLVFIVPQFIDFTSDLEKAQDKLTESINKYQTNADELKTLEDQLKNTNAQLKELYSISDKDLTITNKEDIKRLEAETIELRAQLDLKEKLAEQNAREVLKNTLNVRQEKEKEEPIALEDKKIYQTAESFDEDITVQGAPLAILNELGSFDNYSFDKYFKTFYDQLFNPTVEGKQVSFKKATTEYVRAADQILREGTKEDQQTFINQLNKYLNNLEADLINNGDPEEYFQTLIKDAGLSEKVTFNTEDETGIISISKNLFTRLNKEEQTNLSKIQEQVQLYNFNRSSNKELYDFFDELITYIIEEQKIQQESDDDLLAKADIFLTFLREKETLNDGEISLLADIRAAAARRYSSQMDRIAVSLFDEIDTDEYKNLIEGWEKGTYNEANINDHLTAMLDGLDPQKFLDEYYHGLSVVDVFKILLGIDDGDWGGFLEAKGVFTETAEETAQATTTIASSVSENYDKIKTNIDLIKAAQEQLSSKKTLTGWEQEEAFNDLLKEFGILEEWNNLLGYTSDEKIAWLEEYLEKNISIAELEKERANALRDLQSERKDLSEGILIQTSYVDSLKEQLKGKTEGTDEYNQINAQLTEAEETLEKTQAEYDAIILKIQQLQNVDEDTAKLILSQYDTVQKLNKAKEDGIILEDTYDALYSGVLQRQLESLGITQETFNTYKELTGATDEMAINILTASQNMSALKSALPSKDEFDFSSLIGKEDGIQTAAMLYGSQISGLGSIFTGMFGKELTEDAQKLLFDPEFLAIAQAGFVEGNEEQLEEALNRMKIAMQDEGASFETFIAQYIKGFQEFTDDQLKTLTGITDKDLAERALSIRTNFESLESIFDKDVKISSDEDLVKYKNEINDLYASLKTMFGDDLIGKEAAYNTLFDSGNLQMFQEGINGSEDSLKSFLKLFFTGTEEEWQALQGQIDAGITDLYVKASGYSEEFFNAAKNAFGENADVINEYIQGQDQYNTLEQAFSPISDINFEGRNIDWTKPTESYSTKELLAIDATRTALNNLLQTTIPFNFFLHPDNLTLIQKTLDGDTAALNLLIEALKNLEETEGEDFGEEGGLLAFGEKATEKYIADQESQREKRKNKAGVSDLTLEDTADEILDNDKALQRLEDQFDDTAEEAEEFRDQLRDIAATVIIQEKSYTSLRKSLDKYNDLLEDTEATSVDFKEANAEIAEALQGIFGDSIDLDFVDKYRDKIETFAQGGEEAVDAFHDLQAAAQQEYILDLRAQLSGDEEALTNLDRLEAEALQIDGTEIGLNANLNIDNYVATLNDMIAKSQITMETANGLLRSIGYQAITGFDFVPTPDTSIKNSGHISILGVDLANWEMETQQTGQIAVPKIIGTTPIDAPKGMSSSRPSSSGRRGGGGGGSKKTPSKPKTEKPKEDDTDPFHDINIKIQKLGENYEELEDKREGLLGDDLVDNLNKELDILDKQNEAYREKLRIAELLKRVQQEELSQQGVEFDANGQISNYEQILNARLNALNDMVNKYNHMSAEEQEAYESTLEKAQEDYDKLVEGIEKYEELINDTVPEVQQELRDNLNKKIEIEMEKFKLAVDVRLDMGEAQRDWNEFKNKVIKELDDEDILGGAKANLEDLLSYYNTNGIGGGAIQSVTEQIRNTMIELNKINSSGWSSIYGENHQQALEDLKNYTDELKSQLEDVKDLTDEINESVLDTIDKIKDDFDKQIDAYSQVSDLIQHDMRVIELLYGEDEYGALGEFYDKQAESNKSQIEFLRMQTEFWRQQMAQTDPGTEAWGAIKENYEDSLNSLNDALEDALQNMIDKYTNAINEIFDKLENKVTDGLGLDYVGEEWDLINRNADQYLDIINAAYAIQNSQQKYLDAINESADPAVQRRLNDLMNDQLKILREKEKITQYDVDRANMMLDIELKRIALEEQQQNKTKLRLRRDTQGNYTYQYVTDEDNIAAAREELAAAQNDLYNFDKAQYQNTLNEMYDTYKEFQEKMLAIYEDTTMTDEERERQKVLIIEQYGQLINNMTAENAQIRKNLEESAFTDLADIYDTNIEQYQNMTKQEKDILLNDLVPAWDSGIQHMVDTFVSEGGFVPTCIESFEKLNEAMQEYKGNVESITGVAGLNTDDLQQGVDVTVDAANQLIEINDQLIDAANQEMNAIKDIVSQLDQLIAKYTEAKNAAVDAVNSGFSAYQGDQHQNALDYEKDHSSGSVGAAIDPTLPVIGQKMRYMNGKIYASPNGAEPSSSMITGQEVIITQIQPGALKPYRVSLNGQSLGWLDKTQLARFKSGGYTGEWGDYGKLAVLDEKELVLEKDDTANILAAVNIVRDIANDLDTLMMERLANISAGIGIPSKDFPSIAETIEQQVHIDASFPNVTSSDEIQNAFNNLVNIAAQRAMNSNR